MNDMMATRMACAKGFLAALDQSGGSTPGALRSYGVDDGDYSDDGEMFRLIHEMRVRIMTAPAFRDDRIIAAILFEATMDEDVSGKPTPAFLWEDRGIVPFLKVDKGLEAEADGVSLMKAMPALDATLERAVRLGIHGTKMRSTIRLASRSGISAIVAQQFEVAARIAGHGLMPILEPEILIRSPDKAEAEDILLDELLRSADDLPDGRRIMVKLTLPEKANHYERLIRHDRVVRVVALSGGYGRDEACKRLAVNDGLIASFSRALIGDLRRSMNDSTFDAVLASAIEQIFQASTVKVGSA
ncbi:fructose bisphosphate aldolase [Sphingomonas sp. PAMC26645]|uniref:fructose bisphosphate aldolase n=1 Tax=Sphingomonas sp. PAMC26645 TaxID=2565555 RepID=UPI00109D8A7C|nr:fructose bisphosphate aldolase [Sphingomonas sp. PAMC26645]QCB43289.1 fructose bisphosphate aldolase [Sphingomonas sp. PAMC26645]